MNRISFVKTIIAKSDYKEKEEVEGGIYLIHFDPAEKEGMGAYECVECSVPATDYNADEVKAEYEAWKTKHEAAELAYAIRSKMAEIEAYDTSSKVNGFYLNGILVPWSSDDDGTLNKNIRMGLRQNIKDKLSLGEENIDMWLGVMKITMPCEKADAFMCNLENYAYECFNVTAKHKADVAKLGTVEEVEAFDVTADYPQQLVMKL